MLKTLHEKFRVGWMFALAIALFYAAAWGFGLNRDVGPPVITGWGNQWDGDTLKPNIIQIWADSLHKIVFEWAESTTAVIPVADSALKYTWDGIKDYHIDWGTGTNQVCTDDITEGSSNLFDQALPDSADWSTAYSWGDHSTQNYIDKDNLGTWKVFYSDDGTADWVELALGADGTYLRSNGASAAPTFTTPPGADPGAAIVDSITDGYDIWHKIDTTTATIPVAEYADSAGLITDDAVDQWDLKTVNEPVDEDILTFESTTGDFEWHTPAELGLATETAIHDSIWSSEPILGGRLSHFIPQEDSMAIYYGAARGTIFDFNLVVNFSVAADDQYDSVWIPYIMPSESPDLDSFVIPAYFTSGDDPDSAGLTVHVFKKTGPLGDTTRIYNGTPLKTDHTWTYLAIAGASIDPIGPGDELIFLIVSRADAIDSVGFKNPVPYSPQT